MDMKVKHMRRGVIALAAVALAIPVFTASATVIVPAGPRVGSLVQVGPVAAENGFPTWYRDNNGAGVTSRLEMCLPVPPATADPICAPPDLPNPNAPMVYPTNYPNEIFYQLATAAPSANTLVEMNLEGAYATGAVIPGDEIVFGRIRIRDRTIADGVTWRVTHPYGIDEITATGGKGINMTQDVGLTPGAFGTALGSRIGPFLKWDPAVPPAAPAGYTGDPAVPHAVVGSPYGTNSVKVEQKNPDGTFTLISQTALFSVQGRYATNSGVDVDRAVYAQQADGTGTVDVFASSEVGQSIQVKANAAVGFSTSLLRGEQGRYFGRLPVTAAGGVPSGATIDVINAGDKPVALKTVKLADIVTITSAVYTVGAAGSSQLVVTASSSDALNNPALAVTGFGPLVGGTGTFTTDAPPPMITVTSARGGSATITVSVTGPPFSAIAPVAAFTAPATATSGQTVTLNGTGSTGDITTWTWTQTAGPAVVLTGAGTSIVTFSPVDPGTYTFELVVAGPGGTSAPASNSVVVSAAVPLVANAGVDQAVQRGTLATLDASATSGQKSLAWTQTLGQTMTLSSTTATKPTFTYPLMALPSAPVGSANPGYVRDNAPLTFQMTALGVDGVTTASDTVVISPLAETISGVTARYRTGGGGWRVTGTTSILAGQRVTVVLGPLPTGRTIGTATVDNVGAFSVRAGLSPDPRVPAPTATQVTVISQTGAMASFNLTITT
jgi:hypothetical protein